MSHHVRGADPNVNVLQQVLRYFGACLSRPSTRHFWRLYQVIRTEQVLEYIDPFVEAVAEMQPNPEILRKLATRLAVESPERNPVKVGIALLGLVPNPDLEVLLTLGRHDEFTLYVAVALDNSLPEPDRSLWELGKTVEGWGRIFVVERLENTHDKAIQDWILRKGFRNQVMYEYLAYIAAASGGLLPALSAEEIDDELFEAAGLIISALIAGGPARDINDYADSEAAIERYLVHAARKVSDFVALRAVADIADYLAGLPKEFDALDAQCAEILARPTWRRMIEEGLRSSDRHVFWDAVSAARTLEIDTYEELKARIRQDPLEDSSWYHVVRQSDSGRFRELAEMAAELLPLNEIASGPALDLGLGPEFRADQALDFLLQERKLTVEHWPLVRAALRSRVIRTRNLGLNNLEAWDRSSWPSEAMALLAEIAEADPQEDVAARARALLTGEESSEPD